MALTFEPHNTENHAIRHKSTAFFRRLTAKNPKTYTKWLSLGCITDAAYTSNNETLDHFCDFKGIRSKDKQITTLRSGTLTLTLDELVQLNLQLAFQTKNEQANQTADVPEQETKTFSGTPQNIQVNDGNTISAVLSVQSLDGQTTYTEGTGNDYTVNLASGTITRTAGSTIPSLGTVIVTYEHQEIGFKYGFLDDTDIEGQLRFKMSGEDVGPKTLFVFNKTRPTLSGDISFPMDAWITAAIAFELLEDEELGFGNIYQWT